MAIAMPGALIHAAGELEGIAVPDPLTVLKVQLFKELQRGALCFGHIHLAVRRHALDDLLADRAVGLRDAPQS